MAARFLILILIAFGSSQVQASHYSTYASTYNAHTINHAVAYPVSGSKVVEPAVSAPPSGTLAAADFPAVAPPNAVAATNAVFSKPGAAQHPVVDQAFNSVGAQLPLAGPGPISYTGANFALIAPGKFGFPAASVVFSNGNAYAYGPLYAANPTFDPSYKVPPAYTTTLAAAPAYGADPVYGADYAAAPAYASGTATFATGSSPPAYAVASLHASSAASAFPSYAPW